MHHNRLRNDAWQVAETIRAAVLSRRTGSIRHALLSALRIAVNVSSQS